MGYIRLPKYSLSLYIRIYTYAYIQNDDYVIIIVASANLNISFTRLDAHCQDLQWNTWNPNGIDTWKITYIHIVSSALMSQKHYCYSLPPSITFKFILTIFFCLPDHNILLFVFDKWQIWVGKLVSIKHFTHKWIRRSESSHAEVSLV